MDALKFVLFFCILSSATSLSNQKRNHALRRKQEAHLDATIGNSLTTIDARVKRSYDSIYERWLEIISQYGRKGGEGGIASSPWSPFPADLPIGVGKDGRPSIMPVLILPVPVPYPSSKGECSADKQGDKQTDFNIQKAEQLGYSYDEPQPKASTDYLIEVFRQQLPRNPQLPPTVFNGYAPQILQPFPGRGYLPPARDSIPSLPRFDRSLAIRGFLTVNLADYTEAYTVMYDARSGSARMEYHDQSAISIRNISPDGYVQRFVRHTDRQTEQDLRVCGVTSASRATPEDREPPALPNTRGFTFRGYKEEFGIQVEIWRREILGQPGELGAERGEELTYRHELLVDRKPDDSTIPIKYTVAVDSSVLGSDCEGYQHVYSEVQEVEHDQGIFTFEPSYECDRREPLYASDPVHMARLEPLLEFTSPYRDPRYNTEFDKYKNMFERTYADNRENALRKTLFIQNSRFTSSGNRQSGTFTLGANFLSDRLDKEVEILQGALYSDGVEDQLMPYPYSGDRVNSIAGRLPKEFDWRSRGAVSPVKFQGASCSSCWAFAVVASVEGAYFIRTSQLVELSEQTLVDCGASYGCHGCRGTWPPAAFEYVKDRGLPKRDEYTPYMEKVLQCRAPPIPSVTHIESFHNVTPNSIDALKIAIRRLAPTVVIVDSSCKSFKTYQNGVLHDDRCVKAPRQKLDHAVVSVGWGELRGDPHFIIKNSWSAVWGEGGYIRLHAPSNTCGHLTNPTTTQLLLKNIDRLPAGARPWREGDGLDSEDNRR